MGICASQASNPNNDAPPASPTGDAKEVAEQLTLTVLDGLQAATPSPFNLIFISINKVIEVYRGVQNNRVLSTELLRRVKILSCIIVPILYDQTDQQSADVDGKFVTNFVMKSSADAGVKLTCESLRNTLSECVDLLQQLQFTPDSTVSALLQIVKSPQWTKRHAEACASLDKDIADLNLALAASGRHDHKSRHLELKRKIDDLQLELKTTRSHVDSDELNQLSESIAANIFEQLKARQIESRDTLETTTPPTPSVPSAQRASRQSVIRPNELWFQVGSLAEFTGRTGKFIHHGSIVRITKINDKLVQVVSERSGEHAKNIAPHNLSPVNKPQNSPGRFSGNSVPPFSLV